MCYPLTGVNRTRLHAGAGGASELTFKAQRGRILIADVFSVGEDILVQFLKILILKNNPAYFEKHNKNWRPSISQIL